MPSLLDWSDRAASEDPWDRIGALREARRWSTVPPTAQALLEALHDELRWIDGEGAPLVFVPRLGEVFWEGRRVARFKRSRLQYRLLRCIAVDGARLDRAGLYEAVWDQPWREPHSLNALHVAISRLRGVLDQDVLEVVATFDGYELTPSSAVVDWVGPGSPGYAVSRPSPTTPPPRLIGRDALLDTLQQLLSTASTPCVLVGPPGVGKTSVARALVARQPDFVWVPSSAERDVHGLVRAVLRALGVPRTTREPLRAMAGAADGRRLVLDNVEQIPDVEAVLEALVDGGARLIVTTRRALRLSQAEHVEVRPLHPEDATTLLATLTDGSWSRERLTALVPELGGLPLAIGLAARKLDLVTPERLAQDPGPLSSSVDGTFEGVQDALSAATRQGWARLTLFRTPFDLDDAVALLGPSAEAVLRELRAWRLLEVEQHRARTSFAFLPPVREFGRRGLAAGDSAWARYVDRIVARAVRLERDVQVGAGGEAAMQALEALLPELLASSERALDLDAERALAVATALHLAARHVGDWGDVRSRLDALERASRSWTAPLRGRALLAQARALETSSPSRATQLLHLLTPLLDANDHASRFERHLLASRLARDAGQLDVALQAARSALDVVGDDPLQTCRTELHQATALRMELRLDEARATIIEALRRATALDLERIEISLRHELAFIEGAAGNLEASATHVQAAAGLVASRPTDRSAHIGQLQLAAIAYGLIATPPVAFEALDAYLDLLEPDGVDRTLMQALRCRVLALVPGRLEDAKQALLQVMGAMPGDHFQRFRVESELALALLHLATGETTEGLDLLHAAHARAVDIDFAVGVATSRAAAVIARQVTGRPPGPDDVRQLRSDPIQTWGLRELALAFVDHDEETIEEYRVAAAAEYCHVDVRTVVQHLLPFTHARQEEAATGMDGSSDRN